MNPTRVQIDIYEMVETIWKEVKIIDDERLRAILFVSIVSDIFSIILDFPGEKK